MMPVYEVLSPSYSLYEYSYGMAGDPPEDTCDYMVVEAKSKRDAIIKAVREFLGRGGSWANTNVDDGSPPWKGYKAERVPDEYAAELLAEQEGA